ncbi:hypothetical protein BJ138DRAFT_17774 [Hygrophoropsis aurantiaca]|uniref:Uncharacterized protein n=1 Tax=Hygrophoropsis aurantiaca TaxID=72124 RepID=A0ACB8ATF0_9AGAM|nr:hypothetical protein BJ138DRAFT_17774 [Hygrophoropsis aurantiaca]
MLFFNSKPKVPTNWPSPYHNKCSQRDCIHANNPKTVKGVYQCKGVPGGFFCEGTYKISSTRARETERYLQEMARQAAEEEERRRRAVDMNRMETDSRWRGKPSVDRPALEEKSRNAQAPRSVRGLEIKRVPGPLPYSRPESLRPEPRGRRPSLMQPESQPRPSEVRGRRPSLMQPEQYPRSDVRGRRPSQVQREQEYVSDQIMMKMYPDQRIQPRWI